MPDFQKYGGTSCPMAHLRLYGVAMTKYLDDQKVLVQIFLDSLLSSLYLVYATWPLQDKNLGWSGYHLYKPL